MTEFLKKVTKTDIRHILAVMVTVGCFILLYLMQVKEIPQANKDVVNIVCGFVFGGGFNSVMGYFFGSSKTETKTKDVE
jgi:hypothetical protein